MQLGRRVQAHQPVVVGLAVGQVPHAVVGPGARAHPRELLVETAVGRVDGALELALRAGHEPLARRVGEARDLAQPAREIRREHVLRGLGREEACDPGLHALDHEARRQHAVRLALSQPVDHLVEGHAELREPRDVVLRVARDVRIGCTFSMKSGSSFWTPLIGFTG